MPTPFPGIPPGRVQVTPVPNVIFSELLPAIDDLAELKVTLHVFYVLVQKKGKPRYVTLSELRGDTTLMRALGFREDELQRGLQKAELRGALLRLIGENEEFYFFNTAESHREVERVERGEAALPESVWRSEPVAAEPPNVFKLYEQNIGALTPMIAEQLKAAEAEYPPEIILDAFRTAAENNKRAWSYVRQILLNWAREGKHETSGRNSTRERKPYIQGKLADVGKQPKK